MRARSMPRETPLLPMVAGTVVTLVSLPIYAALYHWHGAMGLAIASDMGIALQTVTIAVLLHQRHMVSLASLDYAEMGRCLLAALASGAGVWMVIWGMGSLLGHLGTRACPRRFAGQTWRCWWPGWRFGW